MSSTLSEMSKEGRLLRPDEGVHKWGDAVDKSFGKNAVDSITEGYGSVVLHHSRVRDFGDEANNGAGPYSCS